MEANGSSVSMRLEDADLATSLQELGPRHGFGKCVVMTATARDGRAVVLVTLLDGAGEGSTGAIEERLRCLLLEARSRDAPAIPAPTFTPAERQVLRWLRLGRTNREIGRILYKSEYTVKTHVQHMLAKTGLDNRLQLAAVAES